MFQFEKKQRINRIKNFLYGLMSILCIPLAYSIHLYWVIPIQVVCSIGLFYLTLAV